MILKYALLFSFHKHRNTVNALNNNICKLCGISVYFSHSFNIFFSAFFIGDAVTSNLICNYNKQFGLIFQFAECINYLICRVCDIIISEHFICTQISCTFKQDTAVFRYGYLTYISIFFYCFKIFAAAYFSMSLNCGKGFIAIRLHCCSIKFSAVKAFKQLFGKMRFPAF